MASNFTSRMIVTVKGRETYDIWKDRILRVGMRVNESSRAELWVESDRKGWMDGTYHLGGMIEFGRLESDMIFIGIDDGPEVRKLQGIYKYFEKQSHYHSRWFHRCFQVQPHNQIPTE